MEAVREAVREALPVDHQRFAELLAELVEGIVTQRGGSLLIDPDRRGSGTVVPPLSELLDDGHRLVLVGTLDDVVTGVMVCHHEDRAGHGRHGVLDACFVEPEARGVGLGHLLLDSALAWLGSQGCVGVDGAALPGDRAAKSFFEAAGFKARVITMHRPLG
jgi:ribosomal protein S18 acetylase RimI-like enzyme